MGTLWVISAFVSVLLLTPAAAVSAKTIHVDDDAQPGGNGSGKAPFASIAEAVAAANPQGGDTVKVAPGLYEISESVRIETPLILRGSNEMLSDENGWPTGEMAPGTETRLVAAAALGPAPILAVGRSDFTNLSGAIVSGLTIEGGDNSVEVVRTQGFTVKDCKITKSGFIGIFMALSSGRVSGNYLTETRAAGIIASAGNADSPAYVEVVGNRSVRNGNGGFLANGSGTDVPEFAEDLTVVVRDNDFSENTASPLNSFGIRIFVLRRDLGDPIDTQDSGNVNALIQGNRLFGNRIGISIDGGFPYRRVGTLCDSRVYTGNFNITLKGNEISESVLTPALIAFTRNTAALNQGMLGSWQYLHGATYIIEDPDETLAGYWLDHPEHDPFPLTGSGPCPADATNEALGNTLIYNGVEIGYGRTVP
ncbi:MAG: DUF1565 domain-containing protein [Deltaproteobacteria bacterium]|nr:DUF1565 domain-containing protein [Deltaproteobacteria bacterium]